MKIPSNHQERRKHRRTEICLPLNLQLNENEGTYPGLTIDASESGLLVQSLKDIPVSTRLSIEVLFPREFKLSNFRAETEVIWKDSFYWEDLEGYQYGLKFVHISNEDYLRMKKILSNPVHVKDVYFAEGADHHSTLIVKTD